MNATQTIMDAIRILQDEHCRKCRIGQALINLKPLLDESPPQEDRDAPSPEPMVSSAPIATRTRRAARARKPVRNLAARRPKTTRAATSVVGDLDQHLTKVCSVCLKDKPLAEFPRNDACSLGVAGQCKACIAAKVRARNAAQKKPATTTAPKTTSSGNRIADLRGIELPFTCAPCRARFRTQAQLDEHNRVHHSDKDGEDDQCSPFQTEP